MAGEVVIRAEQLTKRYGANLAVDHIDLEVDAGEIVGILGPNGSGKTTTSKAIAMIAMPTTPHRVDVSTVMRKFADSESPPVALARTVVW